MVLLPVLGIFKVRTDVDACDCTRGLLNTVRESALAVVSGIKNPLPHWGLEPVSVLHLDFQSEALPTEHLDNTKHAQNRHFFLPFFFSI